jgi:hypothetical protein
MSQLRHIAFIMLQSSNFRCRYLLEEAAAATREKRLRRAGSTANSLGAILATLTTPLS